jgi:hypothetical protein
MAGARLAGKAVCFAFAFSLWPDTAVRAEPCNPHDLGSGRIAAVQDSHTLALADGRKIRLAGIEWAVPAAEARQILSDQLLNRTVALGAPERAEPDRYGRIYAFPSVSGSETPIQYGWLAQGIAVVTSRAIDETCRKALLEAERPARAQGLGAFAKGGSAAHKSVDYGQILAQTGRFAVVEGKVLSVREAGNTIYVNFGRRWSEDFTVTIAKRLQPAFISAGVTPKSLSGQVVRVRGIVEERGGPWIEATSAAQFEIVAGRRTE